MKLIICGNGFDLHHGLKTSYDDYCTFLQKHNPCLKKDYENFPGLSNSDSPWADIEASLSIDYSEVFYHAVADNYPDLASESDSHWIDIEQDLRLQTNFIFDFTGEFFFRWLSSVDYSKAKASLPISPKSLFVTFNYTDTLQRLYGVLDENILHIHGSLKAVNSSNCIGADILPSFHTLEEAEIMQPIAKRNTWNNECIREAIQFGATDISMEQVIERSEKDYGNDELYGASIIHGKQVISDVIERSTKNVEKNLPTLTHFLSGKAIDKIIVMGPSLGEGDMAYYDKVIVPLFRDVEWIFALYGQCDGDNACAIEHFVKRMEITNYTIVEWCNIGNFIKQ